MPVAPSSLPPPPPFAPDWALFLDVDGTLVDFADRPDAVRVPDGLGDTLAALHRGLDGALALVSGRSLAQLDALFAPLRLPAVGLHGLELRTGDRVEAAPPPPPALHELRVQAHALAQRFPGAVVEDKGSSLALHWRGNGEAAEPMRALAQAALAGLPGYRLQPGNQVVELRPQGADKGVGIAAMLEAAPFRGRRPVFVGDDHTDEHGFEAVLARGGIAVLVGERSPSAARHGLADTRAVRGWLEKTARACLQDAPG